jgi:hypothetical protein
MRRKSFSRQNMRSMVSQLPARSRAMRFDGGVVDKEFAGRPADLRERIKPDRPYSLSPSALNGCRFCLKTSI